jgi:hypothetical protein
MWIQVDGSFWNKTLLHGDCAFLGSNCFLNQCSCLCQTFFNRLQISHILSAITKLNTKIKSHVIKNNSIDYILSRLKSEYLNPCLNCSIIIVAAINWRCQVKLMRWWYHTYMVDFDMIYILIIIWRSEKNKGKIEEQY